MLGANSTQPVAFVAFPPPSSAITLKTSCIGVASPVVLAPGTALALPRASPASVVKPDSSRCAASASRKVVFTEWSPPSEKADMEEDAGAHVDVELGA